MPVTHLSSRLARGKGQPANVAGDFVLGAGWGSTAVPTPAAGSNDDRGRLDILCQGAGIAANPTLVFTFKEGFESAPFMAVSRHDAQTEAGYFAVTARTVTTITVTFVGTPTTGKTYTVGWHSEQ